MNVLVLFNPSVNTEKDSEFRFETVQLADDCRSGIDSEGRMAGQPDSDRRQARSQGRSFLGTKGIRTSILLCVPTGVIAEKKVPCVVAIHGIINSRETQDGFAIEFARRGYVVLALDQTGHGYSDPPAFGNGYGGIDGLNYLRSLNIVDVDHISLEGHSM